MHDLASFATQVARMRTAQNKYFRSRSQSNMKEALAIEANVDRTLRDIAQTEVSVAAELATQPTQTSLF